MSRRGVKSLVLAAAAAAAVLVAVVTANTLRWVDTTFPGFFVISNRVVPSIALPSWSEGDPARFFQCEVLAVDGIAVTRAAQVYEMARREAPGTPLSYELRCPSGRRVTATVPTRRFTGSDYLLLFGAYLLNGVAFLGTGLLVVLLKRSPASLGLLAMGAITGIFITTAADLYGPHWLVRLHVLAEAMLAPSFVHLALVFPTERLGRRRRTVLGALYGSFAVFAVAYEVALGSATAYTAAHLVASATHGAAAIFLILAVAWELVRSASPLVRRRVAVVASGTLGAFLVPGLLMAASAAGGGKVPLNAGAFTASLFPLSLGYAIVKQDLFDLDLLLRRAITYATVVLILAGFYLGAFTVAGWFLSGREYLAQAPLLLGLLNLALVLLFAPLRARVQDGVDRVFFRHAYAGELAVSDLGQRLLTAHTFADVVERTLRVLESTVCPRSFALLRWGEGGVLRPISDPGEAPVALPPALRLRLERGQAVACYEWQDESGRPSLPVWAELAAEILLPVGSDAPPLAVLALGRKESGRAYTAYDVTFLRTVTSQVALAMTNAEAFGRLEQMNVVLDLQVQERTASLVEAKADLEVSLQDLRAAYEQLERNQASLVRAERLATLGRLAAGVAHEVNTPLGAAMNTFQLVGDLSREYIESIDDPAVTPDDHREIAREIGRAAESGMSFSRKAAAYINKVRAHGRESRTTEETFALSTVIEETATLLAHRLRVSCCRLEVDVEKSLSVCGVPEALGQALVNLLTNSVDAYEDAGLLDGRIEVRARRGDDGVVVTVRDWAGGVPPDVLPHIFEELFTTKEPGRGTGLGLWIARNLIEQSFGGVIDVEVDPGVGICFAIVLPAAARPVAAEGEPLPGRDA